MLPIILIEGDANTHEDTLVGVKAAALTERLAHKLPQAETKTLGRKLGDSESRTTN